MFNATIIEQAATKTALLLRLAIHDIDTEFGPGYAAKNPQLVATYMQTAVMIAQRLDGPSDTKTK